MKLTSHIIATTPLAGLSFVFTKSLEASAGLVLGGILIDIDHLLEFWYDRGFSLNMRDFFSFGNNGAATHFFILLHSYEFFFLLLAARRFMPVSFFWEGIAVGLAVHILLDYINIVARLQYKWYSFILFSFIFRLLFRFQRERMDRVLRHG